MSDELKVAATVDEIADCLRSGGFEEYTDRFRVCMHAMNYLGLAYKRTEELADVSIDCSTLTSQSYWEGAIIGIPFIAESQRVAKSGQPVASRDDALPGDIFVRYRAVSDAPDGQFNHVGLYVGRDRSGCGWIVEARGGIGVILTRSEEFAIEGGIRRYLGEQAPSYDSERAHQALKLARRVPKLGRPGARQYLSHGEERRSHRGIDIYLDPGTPVLSPIAGLMEHWRDDLEGAEGVEIIGGQHGELRVGLLHVKCDGSLPRQVTEGEVVGSLERPKSDVVRYVAGFTGGSSHIHLEVEHRDVKIGESEAFMDTREGHLHNGLLLAKGGLLSLPVAT